MGASGIISLTALGCSTGQSCLPQKQDSGTSFYFVISELYVLLQYHSLVLSGIAWEHYNLTLQFCSMASCNCGTEALTLEV